MADPRPLTDVERARYEWQLWVPGFGEAGQEKLKGASVLISRCGGVGSVVAYELAAAGVGRLVLAHGGTIRPDDLNRQLLMTHAAIGQPRMDIAPGRLRELNPHLEVEAVAENISEGNVEGLVGKVDLVVSCAPLFPERLLLNREAVRHNKPLVDCAMFALEGQVTTILPGQTACLACLYPEPPQEWKREFPVIGAVSGTVACLGAMEAIKVLSGLGEPLAGRMLLCDLGTMHFHTVQIKRRPGCAVCG
jgi:molybdopterin/thiamine biosynthesis adenylyltransferase